MGLGAGISTQANIDISLNLKKSAAWTKMGAEVKELKDMLQSLAKTIGIDKPVSSYAKMSKTITKLTADLGAMKAKNKELASAVSKAAKEESDAQDGVVASIKSADAAWDKNASMLRAIAPASKIAKTELKKLEDAERKNANDMIALRKKELTASSTATKSEIAATKTRLSEEAKLLRAQRATLAGSKSGWDAQFNALNKEIRERNNLVAVVKKNATAELRASIASTNAAARRAAAIEKDISATKKLADSLRTLSGRVSFYERGMDAVFRASMRLKMAGQSLMMVSRQMWSSITDATSAWGEFQFNLNRAAGALQVDNGLMDDLVKTTLDLSTKLRLFPAADVSKALYFWGSTTGQVVSEQKDLLSVMKSVEPIMKASAMTNTDYETTIKGVYSILSQYYNGAVAMAASVTEKLFYVTQKTAAEFPDLINSFKMVGPIANQMNVSFDQMVDLFGQLADLGVRGSMAGRAFRQMFIQMVRPSGPAMKAIENLWARAAQVIPEFKDKNYFDTMFPKGEFVGIEGYLTNLAKATEQLNTAERMSFLAKIATANELPVLTALVYKHIKALHNQTNATEKVATTTEAARAYFQDNWKRLQDSWTGIMGGLTSTLEALKIEVGKAMAEVLTPLVNKMSEVVQGVRDWVNAPENKELVSFLAKLAVVATAAVAAVGGLLTLTGALLGVGAAIYVSVQAFAPFIGTIATAAAGVILLADAFVRNFTKIQDAVVYAAGKISDALNKNKESIATVSDTISSFSSAIKGLFDLIISVGTEAIRKIGDFVSVLGDIGLLEPILRTITALLTVMIGAKIIFGMVSLAKAVVGLATSFIGLGSAMTFVSELKFSQMLFGLSRTETAITALKMLVGPAGIAGIIIGSIAVGTLIAYETNLLGFRDGIDSITDSFRDLKSEIKGLADNFGDAGVRLAATAVSMGRSATVFKQLPYDGTMNTPESGGMIKADWGNKNSVQTGLFTNYADAITENEKVAEKIAIDAMIEWKAALKDLNNELNTYGIADVTGVDMANVMDAITPMFKGTKGYVDIGQKDAMKTTAIEILKQMALTGTDTTALQTLFTKITTQDGMKFSEIIAAGMDTFVQAALGNPSAARMAADNIQKQADITYKPIADAINAEISKGGADLNNRLVKMMTTGLMTTSGSGNLIETGPSISEASDKLSGYVLDTVTAVYQILGKEVGSDLEESITMKSMFDAVWQPIADSLKLSVENGMTSVMSDSMAVIGDEVNLLAANMVTTNIGVGGASAAINNLTTIMQKITDEALTLPDYMKQALMDTAEYLRSRGLSETTYNAVVTMYSDAGKDAAGTANDAIAKGFSEYVDAFTTGVDTARGLKAAITELGKRGSDAKQLGDLLGVATSKWFRKILKHGNLQQKQAARAFLAERDDALIGYLNAKGDKADMNLARRLSHGKKFTVDMSKILLDNIDWKGMSKLRIKLLKKAGRLGKEIIPGPNEIIQTVLGGRGYGAGEGTASFHRTTKLFDTGTPINIGKLNVTADTMTPTDAQALVDNAIGTPITTAVTNTMKTVVSAAINFSADTTSVTAATDAGTKVGSGWSTGFTTGVGSVGIYTAAAVINDLYGSMSESGTLTMWNNAGIGAGESWSTGMNTGLTSVGFGSSVGSIIAALGQGDANNKGGANWDGAGFNAGQTWAQAFNEAVQNTISKTLTFVASVVVGDSPPKAGPLKNIDKGGFNIGKAWGKGLHKGAEQEVTNGIRSLNQRMSQRGAAGGFSVKTDVQHKKTIDININVKGDGKVDKETQSTLRRSVYDALVDSDILSHMVNIS